MLIITYFYITMEPLGTAAQSVDRIHGKKEVYPDYLDYVIL
ncbi:MAG: hypothetical protein ACJAV6_000124 [Candidatus Paceibacteria bacterium]|jgi:hypothetical protein